MDASFILDVYLNFRTAYIGRDFLVTDFRAIAIHYLQVRGALLCVCSCGMLCCNDPTLSVHLLLCIPCNPGAFLGYHK